MAKKLAKWLSKIVVNTFLFVIATIIVAIAFYTWGQGLPEKTMGWLMFASLTVLAFLILSVMEQVWKRWK